MSSYYAGLTDEQKKRVLENNRKWRNANIEKARESTRKWQENNYERMRIKQKEWRSKNQERVRDINRRSAEKNKDTKKDYLRKYRQANIEKEKERNRKYKQLHRDKYRILSNEWNRANPEKARARNRAYQKRTLDKAKKRVQKRRAIKNGQTEHFSEYEWKLLCQQYDHRCLKCGQQKPLTADHVVPLGGSWNGSDTIDNIQPLCLSCNSSKGATYADYRNREPIRVEQLSFLEMIA